MAASTHVVRLTYSTGRQEHAFLEPEAGIAYRDSKQRIAIICGGQNPFADQKQIAAILGIPRLRTHSQNKTVAARQTAEKKTVGHL
ncbi:molybdopterin cofactor-binding domain-containing protein, partial [Acetobacter pasteurianus]|uniref:molybdopterin cofactor-binding domain-containing protein n=1 Tax=Acetobacter pasteurianus TaxID=438 RepID=UPI00216AB86D